MKEINLDSKRLVYKQLNWCDLDFIHQLHSLPEVDEYNTLGIPKDLEETVRVIEPIIENQKGSVRKVYGWVIIQKLNKQSIGMAGMSVTADRFRMGEIYYKLMPDFWGIGYGTETCRKLIDFGFDILKLHRIEAGVAIENKRSIRVLEKAGMTCEGIRRKILPIRGEWKDNYHFAILEEEYIK